MMSNNLNVETKFTFDQKRLIPPLFRQIKDRAHLRIRRPFLFFSIVFFQTLQIFLVIFLILCDLSLEIRLGQVQEFLH